jgi:cyclophilin family peptidyl-prolyl cis-trans isomerase
MKDKHIYIFIIILIIASAWFVYFSGSEKTEDKIDTIVIPTETQNNKPATTTNTSTNTNTMPETKIYTSATIKTNKGDIQVELLSSAPNTVANFGKLASESFYNGVKFHRVIKGFMIQAGDPLSKDESKRMYWGTGGPGYKFNDELKGTETYKRGTVAMANAGPNTNGSQFFIVTAEDSGLPPSYTVFGRVTAGIDVALAIENVATGPNDQPVQDVVINSIVAK